MAGVPWPAATILWGKVGVWVGVGVNVEVGVEVEVAVGVAVGVDVEVAVGVAVGVEVGVGVSVAVGVNVAVDVEVVTEVAGSAVTVPVGNGGVVEGSGIAVAVEAIVGGGRIVIVTATDPP